MEFKFVSDYYIMVGDYNIVQNSEIDRKGNNTANYHPRTHKEIRTIMDEKELVDI